MEEKTYTLTFILREPKPCGNTEEDIFTSRELAFEAFRDFAEEDSMEMYTRIELTEYNWETRKETILAALTF